MSEFNPEEALNNRADKADKDAQRHAKEARNMANFAVRVANKGQFDMLVKAKTTKRFVPHLTAVNDPEVYPLANALLAEQGLQIEKTSIGGFDPQDFMTVQLAPEQPTPPSPPTTEIQ